mmetsp:Transcript_7740/g.14581  ORF Transcript_7740/g.14581 Transcript_7740/m.14581 type:complete len:242 (-) Transcript_7740:470-1195(-)
MRGHAFKQTPQPRVHGLNGLQLLFAHVRCHFRLGRHPAVLHEDDALQQEVPAERRVPHLQMQELAAREVLDGVGLVLVKGREAAAASAVAQRLARERVQHLCQSDHEFGEPVLVQHALRGLEHGLQAPELFVKHTIHRLHCISSSFHGVFVVFIHLGVVGVVDACQVQRGPLRQLEKLRKRDQDATAQHGVLGLGETPEQVVARAQHDELAPLPQHVVAQHTAPLLHPPENVLAVVERGPL